MLLRPAYFLDDSRLRRGLFFYIRNIYNNFFREIVFLEPDDPHLVVKCAKSLLMMPYLSQDNVYVAKQILTIAINMGFNDPTVIEAINDTIDSYRKLVDVYREMVRRNRSQIMFKHFRPLTSIIVRFSTRSKTAICFTADIVSGNSYTIK